MEIDTNTKKIIKYYLKARNFENNQEQFLFNLEKIIILLEKLDNKKEYCINPEYIKNIKEYTYSNITKVITDSLIKNNKEVSSDIFNLVTEGNIHSISDTENIYKYNIFNEEGLTPLHKCINLGDTTILKEFFKKGEKIDIVNKNGHTLLEFACLQKDPNIIQFLLNHGADMKKHLFFRKNYKVQLNLNDIDTAIIIKLCMFSTKNNSNDVSEIDFLDKYISANSKIGIDDITFSEFKVSLCNLLNMLSVETKETVKSIWQEELSYSLSNKLGCPNNNLELILINLVPFINYPFNVSNRNTVTNELIYTIKKICLNCNYILDDTFNRNLINKIWSNYKDIVPYDYIGVILNHIFSKIKKRKY